jgi:anaerobic magnesium-protoporphyrin IX monomethyl ester cyclase
MRCDIVSLDVLLVNPVFLSQNEAERELMSPYFPLGLLYLAAFLRNRGYETDIFDGTFLSGVKDFIATIQMRQPQVVGITALQPNRQMALNLASIAHDQGATVILGGPDPTYAPETYLADTSVDMVIHHEGELTLVEVLDRIVGKSWSIDDLMAIEGIAYRDGRGKITVNPRRPYILNLDELPLPARDLIDMNRYLDTWREQTGYASLSISIARGCPYGCDWCADAVHGQDFRIRSPQNVVAEVKTLMENYQIDRLRIVDDVDGVEREWIEAWAEHAKTEEAVVPFEALYEIERVDVPMLDIRDSL